MSPLVLFQAPRSRAPLQPPIVLPVKVLEDAIFIGQHGSILVLRLALARSSRIRSGPTRRARLDQRFRGRHPLCRLAFEAREPRLDPLPVLVGPAADLSVAIDADLVEEMLGFRVDSRNLRQIVLRAFRLLEASARFLDLARIADLRLWRLDRRHGLCDGLRPILDFGLLRSPLRGPRGIFVAQLRSHS